MMKHNRETVFKRELDQLRGLQMAARAEDISKKNLQIMVNYMMTLAVKVVKDTGKLVQISDINQSRLLRTQKALRERIAQLEIALGDVTKGDRPDAGQRHQQRDQESKVKAGQ